MQSCLEKSGYLKDLDRGDNEDRLTNINSLIETSRVFDNVVELVDELGRIDELKNQPKPKTASLFQTMTLERITLEEALELLSLPRTVGTDPADGVEITVQNGPYGPYLLKDGESRNIQNLSVIHI